MLGAPRTHVGTCESTQLLLAPDAPEGAIATADHQTAGRGRLGRRWEEARATAVLVSILLRPPPTRQAPELSLVAAVAVAETVEAATGLPAQVKWPNDVLLDGCKVAGILAEMKGATVVLGIGLNVNQVEGELPTGTTLPAGSLRMADGRERDREEVLAVLLGRLDAAYSDWCQGGLEQVHAALARRDFLQGRSVIVDGVHGVAVGIGRDGRLHVRTEAGPLVLESGEVLIES